MSVLESPIQRLVGTVIDLHDKSGDNWSRALLQTLDGNKWITAKFRLEIGETVEVNATFNAKFRSFDAVEIVVGADGKVSNEVLVLKLMDYVSGVGQVKAQRLAAKFPNLWETLKTDPQEICNEVNAKRSDIDNMISILHGEQEGLSRVSELLRLGYGNALAKRISRVDHHYVIAIKSPYEAIKYVKGLGWLIADEIGQKMGIETNDPERIEAGIYHYWTSNISGRGHTRATSDDLLDKDALPALLGLPHVEIHLSKTLVPVDTDDDGQWWTTASAREHALTIQHFFGLE